MGNIDDIPKLNSEVHKSASKKVRNNSSANAKLNKDEPIFSKMQEDSAEISNDSVKLFQLQKESKQYVEMIKNVHLLSDKQLEELKENVLSDFYAQDEIVDIITDKILSLSNYKN